jgi:hypothetical protein
VLKIRGDAGLETSMVARDDPCEAYTYFPETAIVLVDPPVEIAETTTGFVLSVTLII